MDARILLKCSASKCNRDLLSFLHSRHKTIKKGFKLKVIIVYDDIIHKLGKGGIKKLPVMIINGKAITGSTAIQKRLSQCDSKTPSASVASSIDEGCNLEDYWNQEMHSGEDDTNENDLMEQVKNRALEQSIHHRESSTKSSHKKDPTIASDHMDNIIMDDIGGDKVSDLESDSIMKKFWENQESTPGF